LKFITQTINYFFEVNFLKMKLYFISILFLTMVVAALVSCQGNTPINTNNKIDHKDSVQLDSQAYKIGDGWGYTITLGKEIYIKQPMIPVIQGIKTFASEADALKVANLVISKLKNHQLPALTAEELQSMGIIK